MTIDETRTAGPASADEAAELDADAKTRLAVGVRAETAAPGLAAVEVREREADAIAKVGRAEASAAAEHARVQADAVVHVQPGGGIGRGERSPGTRRRRIALVRRGDGGCEQPSLQG